MEDKRRESRAEQGAGSGGAQGNQRGIMRTTPEIHRGLLLLAWPSIPKLVVRSERHAFLNSTIPQVRDLVQKRRSRDCGTALQNGLRPENRQQHLDPPGGEWSAGGSAGNATRKSNSGRAKAAEDCAHCLNSSPRLTAPALVAPFPRP